MKYLVYFTLPMSCSVFVDAENALQAANMISGSKLKDVKKYCYEFSVDDAEPDDEDTCEFVRTEKYDEEI